MNTRSPTLAPPDDSWYKNRYHHLFAIPLPLRNFWGKARYTLREDLYPVKPPRGP
jgi:hypothetical protein